MALLASKNHVVKKKILILNNFQQLAPHHNSSHYVSYAPFPCVSGRGFPFLLFIDKLVCG